MPREPARRAWSASCFRERNGQADAPGTFRGLSSQYSGDGFSDMHFDVLAVPAERFAAWIEATRNTGPTLDPGSYAALAWQSMNTRPFTFRAADPELFQQIVTQKLPPGPGPRTGRPHPSVSPRRSDTILGIPGRAVVWTCLGNSDPNSRVSPISAHLGPP